jgi:hypothetical protein
VLNVNVHAGFKSQTAQAVGWVGVNRIIQAVTENHRVACAAALLKNSVNAYQKINNGNFSYPA